MIKECGDKWCLYTKDGSRLLGKHDTEEQAKAQESIINKNKGYTIKDREIFSVGVHNGDKYTEEDLDEMIKAYNELDFMPAIKLGHTKEIGGPAYGYIENLRKMSGKIIADLVDLPKNLYEAILTKRYTRVSAEVFIGLKRAGKTYKKAIGALALLGHEINAVAGLKPLYVYADDLNNIPGVINYGEMSELNVIEFSVDSNFTISTGNQNADGGNNNGAIEMDDKKLKEYQDLLDAQKSTIETLQAEMTSLKSKADSGDSNVKKYAEQLEKVQSELRKRDAKEKSDNLIIPALRNEFNSMYEYALSNSEAKLKVYSVEDKSEKEIGMIEILDRVVAYMNDKSKMLFKEYSVGGSNRNEGYDDPADEVDSRAKKYMSDHKSDDYKAAIKAVLANDPELNAAYSAI